MLTKRQRDVLVFIENYQQREGGYGGDFGWDDSPMRRGNSKSPARKAASAKIAKIPLALSSWIARTYKPAPERRAAA